MNADTGKTYDLGNSAETLHALQDVKAGEEVVEVELDEIAMLQSMNRKDRRAYLRGRPRLDRERLEEILKGPS